MSSVELQNQQRYDMREYRPQSQQRDHQGLTLGMAIGGLALVGLGIVAWRALGPDLRRYMKMRSM